MKARINPRVFARAAEVLIVLIGVALSGIVVVRAHRADVSSLEDRFQQTVTNRSDRLTLQLRSYESALLAERAAFELSPAMDLAAFQRLYTSLDVEGHQLGMQGLGWQVRVSGSELDALVATARERRPDFTVMPAGVRDEYYVVLYDEPADRLGSSWGSDARENATIRPYLDKAIDCACTTLSAPGVLGVDLALPEKDQPVAFSMFVPVYRSSATPATIDERRQDFIGWASAPFRAQDFLNSIAVQGPQLGIRLVDKATGESLATYPAGTGAPAEAVREVQFGGRTWRIEFHRLAAFPQAKTFESWILFLGGSLLWAAVAAGMYWAFALSRRAMHHAAVANDLALTDPLTGLLNRRALMSWLDQRTDPTGLTMFYIDLDGMKETNDQYGHDAGDRLLLETARRLSRCVRPGDVVTRIGGDEFVVIAPGVEDAAVAELLRSRLEQALTAASSNVVRIEASIGMATGPRPGETIEELTARADNDMYTVKTARQLARNHLASQHTEAR